MTSLKCRTVKSPDPEPKARSDAISVTVLLIQLSKIKKINKIKEKA